jgi:hypothetical protein
MKRFPEIVVADLRPSRRAGGVFSFDTFVHRNTQFNERAVES